MLERTGNWYKYLAEASDSDDMEKIGKHTRSGRPLGSAEFIRKIETLTSESLTPRRRGPKPRLAQLSILSPESREPRSTYFEMKDGAA